MSVAELESLQQETTPPEELPLSYGQRALWFLERLAPGNPAYVIAGAARVLGRVEPAALRRAATALSARHPALRTTFSDGEDDPVQRVGEAPRVDFVELDGAGMGGGEPATPELLARLSAAAFAPFDFERGPLWRVVLVRLGEDGHALALAVHHIVSDFWSLAILVRELGELYARELGLSAAPLAAPTASFATVVAREDARLSGEAGARLWEYWQGALSGVPLVLDLPADRPRRPGLHAGAWRPFRLPATTVDRLRRLSRQNGATLYMALLAGFEALLHRYTGQERLIVGCPTTGRTPELAGLVGYLVNPVAIAADLRGDPEVRTLLDRARVAAQAAFAHQDYPFALLAERLQPERDPGRPPLIQALLVLQKGRRSGEREIAALAAGEKGVRLAMGPLTLSSLALPDPGAQLDLTVMLGESEGGLVGRLQYDRELFEAATIDRLGTHFASILQAMAGISAIPATSATSAEPGPRISALPLLSAAERHQLLRDWNAGGEAVPREEDRCLHELVLAQARRTPDSTALVTREGRWSYAALASRALRLAAVLRGLGVGPEVTVGLSSGRSGEMVAGMLGILAAGGAYVPLDPAYPVERRELMLRDSGTRIVVAGAGAGETELLAADGIRGVALADALSSGPSSEARESAGGDRLGARPRPENLAYLIYTSGSTGRPKGVAIAHANAVALVGWAASTFAPGELAGVLASTSISFDLSIFELFVPLALGGTVLLAENALALAELPGAAAVTLVNTVPSAMAELVRAGALPAAARTVCLAGEPLSGSLAAALFPADAGDAAGVRRVWNLYGPSEDTTYSTAFEVIPGDLREPAIGRPLAGSRAYVADRAFQAAAVGVPGELCLGGTGLARGYLGQPERTAERFVPDDWSGIPGARLYRTGDLARFRPEGNLEFLGRIDHQVKVRGFRIELGEIESVLRAQPEVREAAVLVREDRPGDRGLVAYVSYLPSLGASGEGDCRRTATLRGALERRLPAYMVPAAFVVLETLPLTSNGKLDRQALARRSPESAAARTPGAAPRTALEARLRGMWEEILGREPISIFDDFFALGGHSLLATRLISRLRQELGVELPLRAVFAAPTVAALAVRIEAAAGTPAATTPALSAMSEGLREDGLPLSFAQERLWFLDQLEPGNASYNIAGAVRLSGRLSVAALATALAAIVERHDALRATFRSGAGGPVQVVAPAADAGAGSSLPVVDLAGLPLPVREATAGGLLAAEAVVPFDLARGPLLRSTLLRLDRERHLALVTLHHIVADGWSIDILVRELAFFYGAARRGRPAALPPLPIQYPDFAVWQRAWLAGPEIGRLLDWWRERLAGAPLTLDLATDRPRPQVLSARGGAVPLVLTAATTAGLAALARSAEATLFMALLAGFTALLSRYTGQEDLVVGSPIANRTRSEVEGLIGLFVNTLVFRGELAGRPPFGELVDRAREMALGAYAHQDLPVERLVLELQPARDLSRSPLFQVLLVLQNNVSPPFELPGLTLETVEVDPGTAKLDLQLTLTEAEGRLAGSLSYATDLFDRGTAERMAGHLSILLAGAVADPSRTLAELPLLSPAERAQLAAWNATATVYAEAASTLPELFARQVAASPDAVALVFTGETLSYAALATRAGALAAHLRDLGVGPETIVGLCAERSLEMVIALLAIGEAGGAYLPLDPAYPAERLASLLADAEAPVILAQERLLDRLPPHSARLVSLDGPVPGPSESEDGRLAARSARRSPPAGSDGPGTDNLAYVIFTSGSTGKPKGVMNSHRGIVNRILWMQERYGLTAADRVLQKTPYSFDVSVWEFFWPLVTGAKMVLALPGGHQDSSYLVRTIVSEGITVTHFVPSMLGAFLAEPDVERCVSLSKVMASGEALPPELARQFLARTGAELHNLYGPTEAAVDVTWWQCERGPILPGVLPSVLTGVPIGYPVANTEIHLLDPDGNPVPVGVPGELAIGGVQVARGYLRRPELTAERFVPDPFSASPGGPDGPGGPGGRLYRTGDLARRRPGGEVEYLGRLDHQVKLRGLRIELGEIETVLRGEPEVRAAVVLLREDRPGDQRLVAYLVLADARGGEERAAAFAALRRALEERLPAYMVPGVFVALPALPLSASGKIDRRALASRPPQAETADSGQVAPRNDLEARLAEIWAGVLGRARVGVLDNFFTLGGHSLLATRLVSRVRQALGIELPLRAVFEAPTVAALAVLLQRDGSGAAPPLVPLSPLPPLPPSPETGELALSFAQERLWFLDQLQPGSASYNVAGAARLTGRLSTAALAAALSSIVERHAALRTTFPAGKGGPVQRIAPALELPLPLVDLGGISVGLVDRLAAEEAARPFDLAAGPLVRAALLRLGAEEHVLLLTLHHIVSDGWSMGVLLHEIAALYGATVAGRPSPLAPLPLQYADFARWQRAWLAGGELERQLAWWRDHLAGAPALLALPTDRPRPAVRRFRGGTVPVAFPSALAGRLTALGRDSQATLFMVLLAGFSALLGRLANREDLVVGSPVANRQRAEVEGLIGFFVNTLALRADLAGEPSFAKLVDRVRTVTLGAYAHQDVPFEKLVEALAPERSLGHSPLFQVVLAFQNAPLVPFELPGLTLEPLPAAAGMAKFDLTLTLGEAGVLGGSSLDYDRDLFDPATAERLAAQIERLLQGAVAEPEAGIWDLPLLSAAERAQLLEIWSGTASPYPRESTVDALFAEQAARTPDAVALAALAGDAHGEEQLTYRELAARARDLAAVLADLGVGPEDVVALALPRSPALVIAQLAILGAGGAYLPLDPTNPADRLAFLLEVGQASLLLTAHDLEIPVFPAVREVRIDIDGRLQPNSGLRGRGVSGPG
jgi:amino acid adenylation domain-containing protein